MGARRRGRDQVVPVIYCYRDDLGAWTKRRFESAQPASAADASLAATPSK
jgi:hypothetical protein